MIKRIHLFFIWVLLAPHVGAQQQSTTHDLGQYAKDVAGDMIIDDNYMYSFSAGYGVDSIVGNRTYIDAVTEVFKMDLDSRVIVDTTLLQSTNTAVGNDLPQGLGASIIKNALQQYGEGFILFSEHPDDFKGLQVHMLDEELSIMDHKILTVESDSSYYFPQSVCRLGNAYYVGGTAQTLTQKNEFMMKVSLDFELVDVWQWHHGDEGNFSEGFDLQVTPRNTLTYLATYSGIGAGNTTGTNLIELDTNGTILLDTMLARWTIDFPTLFFNEQGDFVFNHQIRYPRPEFHCFDFQTLEQEWYLLLPAYIPETGEFFAHHLDVLDYAICANGDILTTGIVRDGRNNIAFSGFVMRMTSDGELTFLKKVVLPIDTTVEELDPLYQYKLSAFSRVEELPTGDILLVGTAGDLVPTEGGQIREHSDLWTLTLDADGCYNGDCGRLQGDTEVLVIDTKNRLTQPNWGVGTKWYYEYESLFPPQVSYMTYEITDTTTFQGEHVYVLSTPEGDTYMKQSDGRVWIYLHEMEDYQLTYDFNLTHATTFQWDAICPDSIDGASTHTARMTVDTTVDYALPDGSVTQLQTISYAEETPVDAYGSFTRHAIKDIGFDYGGLGLSTGYLTCDNVISRYTGLRCFEHDGELINFVGYPCDSTYLKVSTAEVVQPDISIYPNPSSGNLQIDTDQAGEFSYMVYTVEGHLMESGVTNSHSIDLDVVPGTYILRFHLRGAWVDYKIVIQ